MYPQRWIVNIIKKLKQQYQARAYSQKKNPWQSLLFTLLSARTRDEQTEKVFCKLIAAFPSVEAMARARPKEIELYLKTIGLYRNKARAVSALARVLCDKYSCRVPNEIDALVELPGVGRKTANCAAIYGFGKLVMCVDTHVFRVTNRLGWVKTKTAEKTELALRKIVPKIFWLDLNRVMVQFGRTVCLPGKPKCWLCPVRDWCTYTNKTAKTK